MVGFSFADEQDAAVFMERVQNKENYVPRFSASQHPPSPKAPIPIKSAPSNPIPVSREPFPISSVPSLSNEKITEKKERKESGGGLFGFGRKNTSSKKGKIDASMISAPKNFEHVSHVGYSAQSGFSVENIPLEWKLIFQKAGITDEQLQDKKQRKVVKQFMRDNANLVSGTTQQAVASQSSPPQQRRAPPPPPPSRRAPPPAPPSRCKLFFPMFTYS